MSFTSALNKAIDLAFDKKENVDPKDPKNWFTMNGAHVLDDGVEFWVKKSSIREDGSLTPSAVKEFEASKRGEGFLDKVKSEKETQAQFRDYLDKNGVSYGSPSWESEKAIGIDISVDWYDIEKTQRARIFIPKSQLKDGKAPWWLVKKKLQEMSAELNTKTSRYGGYSYDTPFTTNYEGGQEFSSYGWSKINEN